MGKTRKTKKDGVFVNKRLRTCCTNTRTPFTGGAVMHTGASDGTKRRRGGKEVGKIQRLSIAGRAGNN